MRDPRGGSFSFTAMPTSSLRFEVYHASKPKRRVLVTVAADATLEALHDAIATRLEIRPAKLCLGESEAAVVAVSDLRDGDVLRVALPPLPASAAAPDDDPGAALEEPSRFRSLLRLVLTVAIFIALEEGFQRWVFRPWYRPDLAAEGYLRGERDLEAD